MRPGAGVPTGTIYALLCRVEIKIWSLRRLFLKRPDTLDNKMAHSAKEKVKRKRPKRSSGRTAFSRDAPSIPVSDSEDEEEQWKIPVISDTKRARRCSMSSEGGYDTSARSARPVRSGQKRKQSFVGESAAKVKREDKDESELR